MLILLIPMEMVFFFTTLSDQMHWEIQVWGNETTLPKALVAKSQRPLPEANYKNYGYGLEFGYYRGLPIIYHEGATGSYNAYILRFPSAKTSIVTMGNTNQINAVWLARKIADIVLDDYLTNNNMYPEVPEVIGDFENIEDYLGLYELSDGTFVELVSRNGKLYREIEGREPIPMVYEEANIFHYKTSPSLKLVLTKNQKQKRQFEIYSKLQPPQLATYINPVPNNEAYKNNLKGVFFNDETNTEIILKYSKTNEFTMTKNGRDRTLKLVGGRLFSLEYLPYSGSPRRIRPHKWAFC